MASLLLGLKLPYSSSTYEQMVALNGISSLDEASMLLPQGVFTSFRTYHRKFALHLEDHFSRLVDGACQLGISLALDPNYIRTVLRENLVALEGEDFRIRLSVDLEKERGAVYILVERLTVPAGSAYQNGVKVLLRPFLRENPRVKSTHFIQNSMEYRRLISREINEVLLFNSKGDILEGISSNFYAIIDNVLFTADEDILLGITRKTVLEEAIAQNFQLTLKPINLTDLPRLQEAFLTSSSRAVLPIQSVDNNKVSSGLPGTITESIRSFFQARVDGEIEEI